MPSRKPITKLRETATRPGRSRGGMRARTDEARSSRAVEAALATYSLDGDNLHVALEALRELLGADAAFLFSFTPRREGDDVVVTRAHAARSGSPPPPVDHARELAAFRRAEVETDLRVRMGLAGQDAMRVPVRDGPHLLGWLGIVQGPSPTERQRALLERFVPAFRKRLRFERQLHRSLVRDAAVSLALEELPSAAWVLGPSGAVEYANAAGHARLEHARIEVMRGLRAAAGALEAAREDRPYRVARRRDAAGSAVSLLVEVAPASDGAKDNPRVVAARQLGLTPAQARVLERLARGASNAGIAAELGVAERTVEAHVTAILEKAQVPNRATLIVRVFAGARALDAAPGAV